MPRRLGLGIVTLIAFIPLLPGRTEAALAIDPAYVELRLDKGRPSETVTVTNLTDKEMRYRAHVQHFTYTKEGGFLQIAPDEHSLVNWTKFNPREFTLPPNGSRIIRLSVIPPKNLPPGEYWGGIELEPLEGHIAEQKDDQGRVFKLEIVSTILVPLVGQVGEVEYGLNLKELKARKTEEGIAISAHLVNTGTGRLRPKGTYEILSSGGDVISEGFMGDATILAAGERVFIESAKGDFPEGEYTVRVRYKCKRFDETIAGETRLQLAASVKEPIAQR
jgi:hypothetical protein